MAEIERKTTIKTDDFKPSDVKETIKEVKPVENKPIEKKSVQEVKPVQPIQPKKRMGKLKCFIGKDVLIVTQDGKGITMPNKAYIGKKPGTMVEY